MKRKYTAVSATAGVAAGVLGLTALSLPTSAGAEPTLPPVAPEKLVESVMTKEQPAMNGTVEVNNELGLPAIPGAGDAGALLTDGSNTFQVWADGQGKHRLSLPSSGGETTMVNDGTSVWKWDSAKRETTKTTKSEHGQKNHQEKSASPAESARQIVDRLRSNSTVTVDGTASVAGRDAYELVLTPKPTERTVLREVRIAVDAQQRMPLEVTVNTHGSDSPALSVGFSELNLSKQDPSLFQFSPPAGTKVVEPKQPPRDHERGDKEEAKGDAKIVGDGWDTVVVNRLPQQQQGGSSGQDPTAIAKQMGKRVSGDWGEGWIISTKAGSALLTSDGRLAIGAVPEQVLTTAVGNA